MGGSGPRPPSPHWTGNDASGVIRLTFSGRRILFTGDIQQEGIQSLLRCVPDLKTDILIAPHHGSAEEATAPCFAPLAQARSSPPVHLASPALSDASTNSCPLIAFSALAKPARCVLPYHEMAKSSSQPTDPASPAIAAPTRHWTSHWLIRILRTLAVVYLILIASCRWRKTPMVFPGSFMSPRITGFTPPHDSETFALAIAGGQQIQGLFCLPAPAAPRYSPPSPQTKLKPPTILYF